MPVQTLRVQTLRKIGIHPEGTTPDEPTVTVDDTPMTTPPYEQRHDSINQEGSMHDDTPIMVDDTPLSSSGYKKRPRLGIIPDFRIPKTAKSTALEATIRKFRERNALLPLNLGWSSILYQRHMFFQPILLGDRVWDQIRAVQEE